MEALEAEVKQLLSRTTGDVVGSLVDGAEQRDGVSLVAEVVEARDMDHLLSLVDQVRDRIQPGVVALGADLQGKAALVVSVSPGVAGVDAGEVVKTSAREFEGGGGGTPQLGRGGGGDPAQAPGSGGGCARGRAGGSWRVNAHSRGGSGATPDGACPVRSARGDVLPA